MYIAPFTAILTTARHIDFNKNKNIVDKNGKSGESDPRKSEFESGEPDLESREQDPGA